MDKTVKNLKDQVEELTDQVSEETKAKLAANNKVKHLQDELERLQGQLEDEEEAKDAVQTKLVSTNSQVWLYTVKSSSLWVWLICFCCCYYSFHVYVCFIK